MKITQNILNGGTLIKKGLYTDDAFSPEEIALFQKMGVIEAEAVEMSALSLPEVPDMDIAETASEVSKEVSEEIPGTIETAKRGYGRGKGRR